jgi:hypothetical protein
MSLVANEHCCPIMSRILYTKVNLSSLPSRQEGLVSNQSDCEIILSAWSREDLGNPASANVSHCSLLYRSSCWCCFYSGTYWGMFSQLFLGGCDSESDRRGGWRWFRVGGQKDLAVWGAGTDGNVLPERCVHNLQKSKTQWYMWNVTLELP